MNATEKKNILGLADPAHPAHIQLGEAIKIIDQYVQVEVAGERTATRVSAPIGEMEKALASLDEAIALCPACFHPWKAFFFYNNSHSPRIASWCLLAGIV